MGFLAEIRQHFSGVYLSARLTQEPAQMLYINCAV